MSNTKPYASLTNAEVHDIVTDLDALIEQSRKSKELFKGMDDQSYSMYLAEEIAFMKCRNLILSKI